MFSRSSWLHLRFPFSYFLLPIYLFALCISPNFNESRILWTFIIIHFLLYPASNGYNSYFDKDTSSIGALKNPPPVKRGLYFLALLLDALAIVLGYLFINITFAVMLFIYGLVSKAYSHPSIRLKKYAAGSWLITGLFQGFFTVVMCYVGINNYTLEDSLKLQVLFPALLASLMLWANYPMTQIYQHEEDRSRGDITLSIKLGVRGTFYFTAVFFGAATVAFLFYFKFFFNGNVAVKFLVALVPILSFFFVWFLRVVRNPAKADFGHTMLLNVISGTCLNIFFIHLFVTNSQVLQVFE